ncbi:MAG: hypothetical protein C4519_17155 [Desulfobacteraceae bacterium]|nr:MAG: hypothetical protein C4519_17155 [Desulfobacteraceae bacterium]
MVDFCGYHPTQPAWWSCSQCSKFLCPQCIVQRKGGPFGNEDFFFCPKCNAPATQLDITNIIVPFWRRLHKCFVYPFSSIQSIILILGLSLISSLFSGTGLLGSILRFFLWAIMVKYAYEALRYTSEGKFQPPPLSSKVLSDNFGIVFKQIALFIALFLAFGFFVASLHPLFWMVFGIGVLVGLPAMIIILAVTNDLGKALNPVCFLGMAVRIGRGYLLFFFFLFLLFSAPGVLGFAVIRHMPEGSQFFFGMAAQNYYTLVAYHLMGYVILQYHSRLDYHVDMATLMDSTYPAGLPRNNSEKKNGKAPVESELLIEISRLIQEGDLDGAVALIRQRTQLVISDQELSDRYLNLLKMTGREQEYFDYAPRHLDLLVMAEEKSKARQLYLEGVERDKNFAASPTALFKIGSWFNEDGQAKLAIQALNHLAKLHPQDVLIPKAYYRAAQILHEKLMNTEKAKKILTALVSKYPDHEISNFARTYLKSI